MASEDTSSPYEAYHADVDAAEKEAAGELRLLFPPPGRALTAEHYRQAIQLLLLCRSEEERVVVGLRCYHRIKMPEVAAQLGIPGRRVQEVFDSLVLRLRRAEVRHRSDERLKCMAVGQGERSIKCRK